MGEIDVPGDKSISHRALMIGAAAVGETVITGLLDSADIRATASALRCLGIAVERLDGVHWRVLGRGIGGFAEPGQVLDLGNSGTGARLLSGLLASQPYAAFVTGDVSLCSRPMDRIITPLKKMGARFVTRSGGRLPMVVCGASHPVPLQYEVPVPSAQVKSAVLLAGLNTPGETSVIEPVATRDHTERMLAGFGAAINVAPMPVGGRRITLLGQPEISGREISVPGDPSSAAFPAVAAIIVPGSDILLRGVGVNPQRVGLYETLRDMGAKIVFRNPREDCGEPVADIAVSASSLVGIDVPAARVPTMIDEIPILAIAAAWAKGTTRLEGLAELRVKESDRLAAIADGLALCGVAVQTDGDALVVEGKGAPPPGPEDDQVLRSHMDHRIAMAFLTLGMASERPVTLDDGAMIETSFPDYADVMNGLGAQVAPAPNHS